MRKFAMGLLGTLALAGVMVARQQKVETERPSLVPAGESQPASISLERIRELGY